MIEEIEYLKYASKVDPVDIMIRAKEAQKFIDKGEIDDALAYAIAAGVRLGIKAVLESEEPKKGL